MLRLGLACVLGCALAACGGTDDNGGSGAIEALYRVPADRTALSGEAYLDHPMPSDLRRDESGAPVFTGFYNPRSVALIAEYVEATEGLLDGFSPVAAGYLRFTGPLDPASLPASPPDALDPASAVQLIDVDPDSPERGQRRLILVSFRAEGGVYVQPNTLRWMPALGFPLRHQTRYALVVTKSARGAGGEPVKPSADLAAALEGTGPHAADLAPALGELAQQGIGAADIAHLAVFTTGDPIAETLAVADHVKSSVAPPDFDPSAFQQQPGDGYVEYQGIFGPSPNYQEGTLPFESYGDGGAFHFVNGAPEVVDTFDLRFSLSVPDSPSCTMPEEGWPIVLYAHGTGGGWRSYIGGGYAKTLAEQCIATMGVDQIFHGTRPGAPDSDTEVQILFFNFQNIDAARTNGRQSAIDEVQRARLFTETGAVIPAAVSHTGQDIRFDGSKVMFMGHSQGGLNGPLYLAIDDSARGGVLSGSGSVIQITLLEKSQPAPSIVGLVQVLLGLAGESSEELDLFHPALSLAQTLVDPIDPINYAHLTITAPRPGFAPKSVLMTEGIAPDGTGDNYTPPKGTEAEAIAMGLPLMLPAQRPYEQLEYGAPAAVEIPGSGLSGNLAAGAASGVLAQWPPAPGEDGHFVVFDVPEARAHVAGFLRALADNPQGTVPAP